MTSVRSIATKLGATSGALAKSTLLAAGILGGTLLAGGEAKAQVVGNFFSCTIGLDCEEKNLGWIIGDKQLTWASLPITDVPATILFNSDEGRWNVTLDFISGNSQYGGPTNNTLTVGRVVRDSVTGDVAEAAWTYKLDILDPNYSFLTASAGAALGVGGEGAFFDVVKDVVWNGNVTRLDAKEGVNPQFKAIGGRSLTTTLDWGSCPQCSFSSITDSYRQTSVPGPLPVLGAAAAFGYSRRLRSRIRLHRPKARIEA